MHPAPKIAPAEVLQRIQRVENNLLPAIALAGQPLEKNSLADQMQRYGVPAISIAVIQDGQIEWAKAYGVLEADTTQATDTSSLFQAGSVSKPLAAFGALSLVQTGKLDLDEDVHLKLCSWKIPTNTYTPTQKVTLRHLLSHTAGFNVIGFDGYTSNATLPTLKQILDGSAPANNAPIGVELMPGSKMIYSGGGYTVMQQLVEDTYGAPFADFMQPILNNLGMTNSTFHYPLPIQHATNMASAHPADGKPLPGKWKTYPESAAAGLWTTPTDIAKWLIAIQNGLLNPSQPGVLNHDTLQAMVTPQIPPYGLGTVIEGAGDQLALSHQGRTTGFACGYISFPYLKQGAVVMINADNGANLVYEILRSIAHEYHWPAYQVEVKSCLNLTSQQLDKYVGRYGTNSEKNAIYDIIVYKDDGQLMVQLGAASKPYKLYAESENQFFLLETGFQVIFKEKYDEIQELVFVFQAGFERPFHKFPTE